MSNFNLSIAKLIALEGTKFTDDPKDRGGCTKFGLTLNFLHCEVDHNFTAERLEEMEANEACDIYKSHWWDKYNIGQINDQLLADKVFQSVTNLGANPAIRLVQKAVNQVGIPIHIDGCMGSATINAMNGIKAPEILTHLRANLIHYYESIVFRHPSQKKFLKGWINRANA